MVLRVILCEFGEGMWDVDAGCIGEGYRLFCFIGS